MSQARSPAVNTKLTKVLVVPTVASTASHAHAQPHILVRRPRVSDKDLKNISKAIINLLSTTIAKNVPKEKIKKITSFNF